MKLLLSAFVALLMLPATALAEVPPNADWYEAYIETPGEPTLHVDVLKPKGTPETAKLPVIVSVGPYFAHSGSTPNGPTPTNDGPQLRWRDLIEDGKLFERGYALVQVDLRGFGASAGCNDFGGTGEQTDVKRAVEWAASQPWALNGEAAIYGKSYDAWTGVMALDEKPKGLGAAIIMSPIIDGYRTLYQNGVHYGAGWYGTPALYQGIDAMPPTPFDSPEYIAGSAMGMNPACYAQNIAFQNSTLDRESAFWQERELPNARGSDVPVFWSMGFHDANTKPDNFLPVFETLRGPKRAWAGQYAHDRANETEKVGHGGFWEDLFAFLDHHVKGDPNARPDAEPAIEVGEGDGRWRYEAQWPPADVTYRRMAIKPGTFVDRPDSGSETWSVSAPFPHDARIAGPARVSIDASTVAPRGHLIAQLWDVGVDGGEGEPLHTATLMTRGAHVVLGGASGESQRLAFELYPQDWTVRRGHRLALKLTADDSWYLPPHSGQDVVVDGGALEIPFLSFERDGFIESNETPAIKGRSRLDFDPDLFSSAAVALELPPALVPRPAGTPQGAVKPVTTKPGNRLRVRLSVKGRRITATIRGAGTSRVRVGLLRGRKTQATRKVRARRDVARVRFRARRAGRYTVTARLLDGVRLSGRSKAVRVR